MASPLFHRAHYNIIAAQIRDNFPVREPGSEHERRKIMAERTAITLLALSLAERFLEDNERFDPHKFLTACSPDNDLYPLAELWEGE